MATPQDKRLDELWKLVSPEFSKAFENRGTPYGGEQVAPISGLERSSLDKFASFMDSGGYAKDSSLFKDAKGEYGKIFGDAYDPFAQGGEFDMVKNRLSKYMKEDLLPNVRHTAGASGNLYTKSALDAEEGVVGDVMDNLAQYSYDAQNKMIDRRMGAIPGAMGMAGFEANEEINRLRDTMGMASYERTQVDQPKASAEYNEFLRLAQEMNIPIELAMQLAGTSGGGQFAYPSYQKSPFERFVLPAAEIGAGMMTGGASTIPGGGSDIGSGSGYRIT